MARRAPQKGVFQHSLESPKLLSQLPKSLKALSAELKDFKGAFREMPPILQKGVAQNISTRGATIGQRWEPNTEGWRDRKTREGRGNIPLEYTKHLHRAIASGAGIKYSVGKRALKWGTKKLPYARSVHFGGKPFFVISEKMGAKIQTIMTEHATVKLDVATRALRSLNGR